MTFNIY